MSKKEVLERAERFVRETFAKDLKQAVDDAKVKEIAKKVARSIPRRVLEEV
jgi:hypothetical protein